MPRCGLSQGVSPENISIVIEQQHSFRTEAIKVVDKINKLTSTRGLQGFARGPRNGPLSTFKMMLIHMLNKPKRSQITLTDCLLPSIMRSDRRTYAGVVIKVLSQATSTQEHNTKVPFATGRRMKGL
jgi:hypothetical protein